MIEAAIIAIAFACAGAIGGLITLAIKLSSAQASAGDAAVKAATLTEQDKAKDAAIAELTANLKHAQGALDDLDAEYQKLAAAAPVDGAYQRLLAQWTADRAAAGPAKAAVPAAAAAARTGPDDLLRPGE